ncbi:TetR/AcrR family transcriptional regulator [uncultured Massilia sp.]|uniref:TetR/AcrR family transcriptional regulator n=1 Tax=uncultured Massilia sp. TaxID=169973 RepID=UPI002588E02D|nr:TetR/AcrR family transcriptional regulator [uncultured Massilia sp.]
MVLNSRDVPTSRKRGGRPSAEQAGEVDRRILDAATTLFLRAGFDGTSCDQVLALAGAGKATLYARYANKDALFSAVVHRMVEQQKLLVADIPADMPVRERLRLVGSSLLQHALTEESIGLMRICIATAQRLPELSRMVDCQARGAAVASVASVLAGATPAHGEAELAAAIAERLIDMVMVPQQMRALIGDNLARLDAAAPAIVEDAIDLLDRAGLLDAFK